MYRQDGSGYTAQARYIPFRTNVGSFRSANSARSVRNSRYDASARRAL
jgi:hypothetical protein